MNNLDYGIIGNCRTAALVSKEGSIDWCCLPEFDSASVFAQLLDENIGGQFGFKNADDYTITQSYIENTCVLQTHFENDSSAFKVLDFLPRYIKSDHTYHSPPEIIRYIKVLKGTPEIVLDYDPKLEYARCKTHTFNKHKFIVSLTEEDDFFDSVFLYTNLNKEDVVNSKPIKLSEDCFFLISYNEKIDTPDLSMIDLDYERTKLYWLNWCYKTPKFKHFQKEIEIFPVILK